MTTRYGQLANFFLKASDQLLMLAALSLTILINYASSAAKPVPDFALDFLSTRVKLANALLCALLIVVWYLTFNLQGVYRSHRLSSLLEEMKEIGRAVFFAAVALVIIAQIGDWETINLWTATCVGLTGLALIGSMRLLVRLKLRRLRLRGHNLKTLLIKRC